MTLCLIFMALAGLFLFYLLSREDKKIEYSNELPKSEIQVPMPPRQQHIVTDDEIRFRAYHIASDDGFKKDSHEYWVEAEKELRGSNND